jgi:hypothetical protein
MCVEGLYDPHFWQGWRALIDFLIAFLEDLKTQGPVAQVSWAFGAASLFPAVWFVSWQLARRKYRHYLRESDELADKLKVQERAAKDMARERDKLGAEIERLTQAGPEGYLKVHAREGRDDNVAVQIDKAQDFLARHGQAISTACRTLCRASIGHAEDNDPANYANAAAYARTALLFDRDDRDLHALAEDLEAAAAIAERDVRVRPASPEKRTERLARANDLPSNLAALNRRLTEAEARGQCNLAAEFARQGLRLAERLTQRNSRQTIPWERRLAFADLNAGRLHAGLNRIEQLKPIAERVLGKEARETLFVEFVRIDAISRIGRDSEALDAAKALNDVQERVLGPEDFDTLSTRFLLARCLESVGKARAARKVAQALVPLKERVKGPDHLDTFSTRLLIANCLVAEGKPDEAAKWLDSLASYLRTSKGATHPFTLHAELALLNLKLQCKRLEDGRSMSAEAQDILSRFETVLEADHPMRLSARSSLAKALFAEGNAAAAAHVHRGVAAKLREAGLNEAHPDLRNAVEIDARIASATSGSGEARTATRDGTHTDAPATGSRSDEAAGSQGKDFPDRE